MPGARFEAVGAEPAVEMFAGDDLFDSVTSVQSFGIRHLGHEPAGASHAAGAWFEGRRPYDLAVDALHGPEVFRQELWKRLPSVEGDQAEQHRRTQAGETLTAAVTAAAGAGWGVPVDPTAVPGLHTRPEDEQWADRRLDRLRRPATAVVPIASTSLKQWPVDRYAAACDEVTRIGGSVLLFVGPKKGVGDDVLGRVLHPHRVDVVGEEHLLRQAALLRRCGLYVGNDTGLMHIAMAMGVPSVAIFGPSSRRVILPQHVPAIGLARRGIAHIAAMTC